RPLAPVSEPRTRQVCIATRSASRCETTIGPDPVSSLKRNGPCPPIRTSSRGTPSSSTIGTMTRSAASASCVLPASSVTQPADDASSNSPAKARAAGRARAAFRPPPADPRSPAGSIGSCPRSFNARSFLAVLAQEAVADRHPPAAPAPLGDAQSRRVLETLELAVLHARVELLHARRRHPGLARGRLDRHLALDEAAQDRIELGVRRQAVGVELAFAQLGRRRLLDRTGGDPFAVAVDPARERVDLGLPQVGDRGERAARVAVQRVVADGALALVAGREQHVAELV